jgi:hypothetical protein
MCPVPGLERIPGALAAVGTLTTKDYERSVEPRFDEAQPSGSRTTRRCAGHRALTPGRDGGPGRVELRQLGDAGGLGAGRGQGLRPQVATLVQCRRLMSGVLRSALRNRVVAANPCDGVRIPTRRTQDTDEQFPKTTAGRRTVPLPSWLVTQLREHL